MKRKRAVGETRAGGGGRRKGRGEMRTSHAPRIFCGPWDLRGQQVHLSLTTPVTAKRRRSQRHNRGCIGFPNAPAPQPWLCAKGAPQSQGLPDTHWCRHQPCVCVQRQLPQSLQYHNPETSWVHPGTNAAGGGGAAAAGAVPATAGVAWAPSPGGAAAGAAAGGWGAGAGWCARIHSLIVMTSVTPCSEGGRRSSSPAAIHS